MVESDIRAKIIAAPAVSAIIGSGSNARMFNKNPIRTQTAAYLSYHRNMKTRDMVSQKDRFQIRAFSMDTLELETLCDAVINCLEGQRLLNGNQYYSNSLISQADGNEKLDDGFYWSIMTFEFKHTI